MDTLIFAANAVLPIILLTFVGWILKKIGLFSNEFLRVGNKLSFKVLLPVLLFYNIYNISDLSEINPNFILYGVIAVIAIFVVATAVTMLLFRDNSQRGVLIQAVFRSNYAIIGIPLATLLCGEKAAASASVLSAFSIPLFNVLAVVTLSVFHGNAEKQLAEVGNNSEDGSISAISERESTETAANGGGNRRARHIFGRVAEVILGIIKNPLIIGVVAGLVVLGIRSIFQNTDISFRLSDVGFVFTPIKYIANATTPFALLILGGQFEFSAAKKLWKPVVYGVVMRTVIVPAVALVCAYLFLPDLGGECFAAYIALFGTPVAVSSAIMAKEMGGDGELAAQLVVWTTFASVFTLFAAVLVCAAVGIF